MWSARADGLARLPMGSVILAAILVCVQPARDSATAAHMHPLIPQSIGQWAASESPRVYTGTQIFDYMDGAGEVYRAYAYETLFVQRYLRPRHDDLLLELFDMGHSRSAYGVFSYMLGRGPAVPVGQEGEYRSGLLCFWKGRYFGYIQTDTETEEGKAAVLELGQSVASRIKEVGEKPSIVGLLPEGEYAPTTLRYFFSHAILNSHFFVSDDDILLLGPTVDAVLVRMLPDRSHLLLVEYPSEEQAEAARKGYFAARMPGGAEDGVARSAEGKWTGCIRQDRRLVIVLDGATSQGAAAALEKVLRRLR